MYHTTLGHALNNTLGSQAIVYAKVVDRTVDFLQVAPCTYTHMHSARVRTHTHTHTHLHNQEVQVSCLDAVPKSSLPQLLVANIHVCSDLDQLLHGSLRHLCRATAAEGSSFGRKKV